jgi:hypothetical protein
MQKHLSSLHQSSKRPLGRDLLRETSAPPHLCAILMPFLDTRHSQLVTSFPTIHLPIKYPSVPVTIPASTSIT